MLKTKTYPRQKVVVTTGIFRNMRGAVEVFTTWYWPKVGKEGKCIRASTWKGYAGPRTTVQEGVWRDAAGVEGQMEFSRQRMNVGHQGVCTEVALRSWHREVVEEFMETSEVEGMAPDWLPVGGRLLP